jgi:hypothetical protein
VHRPEERADADAVARAEEPPALPVPERERPLAVHPLDAAVAPHGVRVEDRLGVRARREAPAVLLLELVAQLEVVEDLSVERDDEVVALDPHRLRAAFEVEDREARVRESAGSVDVDAAAVRPAVLQRPDHPLEDVQARRRSRGIEDSCNSAHVGGDSTESLSAGKLGSWWQFQATRRNREL